MTARRPQTSRRWRPRSWGSQFIQGFAELPIALAQAYPKKSRAKSTAPKRPTQRKSSPSNRPAERPATELQAARGRGATDPQLQNSRDRTVSRILVVGLPLLGVVFSVYTAYAISTAEALEWIPIAALATVCFLLGGALLTKTLPGSWVHGTGFAAVYILAAGVLLLPGPAEQLSPFLIALMPAVSAVVFLSFQWVYPRCHCFASCLEFSFFGASTHRTSPL